MNDKNKKYNLSTPSSNKENINSEQESNNNLKKDEEKEEKTINITLKKRTPKTKKAKKKIDKKILIIVILATIMLVLTLSYFNPTIWNNMFSKKYSKTTQGTDSSSSTNESSTSTSTTEEVEAETKTIMNTISSTGEIKTTFEEKLELHTNYYFSEIYVEKNQYIESGTNILKYVNGTYLTAPCNCVVTAINVPDSGSICTNQHSITIKGTDTLSTTVKVSEDELSKIYIGQEAQITVTAIEKTYIGYVTNIGSTATYSSNGSKFTVTIEFQNDGSTLIGMTAKSAIILEKAENTVVVPTEAVSTNNGQSTVTVVNDDGTTQTKIVETGISNDAYIVIKTGITEGTKVQITKTTTSSSSSNGMGRMMQMQGGQSYGNSDKSTGSSQGGPGSQSMGTPPTGN